LSRLDGQQIQCIEGLLKADPQQSRSPYNALKQFPKSPTLSHLKALLSHLTWLQSLENVEQLLKDIPPLKIQHFAAEAKALDVGEIRDFSPPKRYTLLLCLIYQSQIQARDNLVTMFLKRINTIHKRGKEELEKLREQHRQKTEKLVTAFTDILQLLEGEPEETQTALRFKNLLKPHGGVSQLLGDCEAVASYSGNNYLPLLWKFYRQNRSTLFGIIRALELESTSSDQSLMDAINFLLTLEDRRSEWIEAKVELSFASELWQRTVLARKEGSTVDKGYPNNGLVVINETGEPVLKRLKSQGQRSSVQTLEAAIHQRLPERNLIDILHNVEYWINWTRHFGPLSGSDPKLECPTERYLLTTFAYGCNLGASQGARHMRGAVTPRMLSFINRRHINVQKLNEALKDIINVYHQLALPKLWGDSKIAVADGTKFDLYEENLFAEYHIRYGGYGGIAYHHVSDRYIALFSHFIPCGVWEAIYIIEGLLKNTSDIQPNTIHADTQGQSTPVFALAHLLGIKLMPRIRNWKNYTFFRPSKEVRYTHIDSLFSDVINWDLIETHWQDLLRVVLSIKTGKISSSVLLRKLGNYSRKNRLYQAFRELGRVVRTVFLLQYISEVELREQIMAATNKVEAYNGFSKWFFFGGQGIIATNDPEEQEKKQFQRQSTNLERLTERY
jgi:TnpA family transposase